MTDDGDDSTDEEDDNNNEKEDSSEIDSDNEEISDKKKKHSFFQGKIKSAIQWYVRNELFQKIKVVGDEHLELNGEIVCNGLELAKFNPETDNLASYVNATRRIIKRTISSRRSYVKKTIGIMFIGTHLNKSVYEMFSETSNMFLDQILLKMIN